MIVKINIEEHLNKEIQVEVPDNVSDPETYAIDLITEQYKNREIVLDASNYNGVSLMSVNDSEYFLI